MRASGASGSTFLHKSQSILRFRIPRFRTSSRKLFPFLRWAGQLDRDTARADLLAGLTGAAIVLPQGVAFAAIAGMPLEYGLYASIVPAIVAALFGSSWHLISGPTTAASVVMYSSLSVLAIPGSEEYVTLAITLAFMVGIAQFAMALFKMGALVNFISHSVIVGFTAGAALLIAAKQLKVFLGLDFPEQNNVYESLKYLTDHWEAFHPMVVVISIVTIAVTVVFQKKWPQYPGMIAAIVTGSLIAVILNLIFGEETTGIEMVGALPQRLPPLSTPDLSIHVLQDLAPLALAMTLFALTEAVSISRTLALKSGQAINSNQEFFGQGLSNIVGSFFSSYVATGSFNRSAANYEAGAKTPLAAIIAGALLIPVILVIAPLTAFLPKACVAALLMLVALRLINVAQLKLLFTADRMEAAIVAVTFVSTILFKLEFAILLGVILSLMIYLRKTSRPRIESRVPDSKASSRKFTSGISSPECPQLKILRIEDSVYFGSITYVREMFRLYREHYPEQKHLMLLTKGINQIDWAGAELLLSETQERRKIGGDLYLYRLKRSAGKVMKKGGYLDYIGEHNVFDSKHEAISRIFERLDSEICRNCTKRIFLECGKYPYPENSVETSEASAGGEPGDSQQSRHIFGDGSV
ncbi:MAG: SulP family inorganic anion transporter [Gammaproteobacteria bacterium]|nr:SulP family inorganic anion transporter [Gammaproteobacteria bacterium]